MSVDAAEACAPRQRPPPDLPEGAGAAARLDTPGLNRLRRRQSRDVDLLLDEAWAAERSAAQVTVDAAGARLGAWQAPARQRPGSSRPISSSSTATGSGSTAITPDVATLIAGEAAARLRQGAGLPADVEARPGDPGRVIVDVARSREAGLVVVGCRGLGAVRGFFLGSVSRHVPEHAPCSGLVASPAGIRPAPEPARDGRRPGDNRAID